MKLLTCWMSGRVVMFESDLILMVIFFVINLL